MNLGLGVFCDLSFGEDGAESWVTRVGSILIWLLFCPISVWPGILSLHVERFSLVFTIFGDNEFADFGRGGALFSGRV